MVQERHPLSKACHILFLEDMIVKHYLYLSKLAAQMVTSTPLENLSLHLYESQNKNFNFGTLKALIFHARSIFFKGGHPTKIWRKKIFFMKTLSKLGALTVLKKILIVYILKKFAVLCGFFTADWKIT